MALKHGLKGGAIAAAMLASATTTASAQQSGWSYEATIYLFMPETETSFETPAGKVDGTLSFSDALENLDFAFMGALAATNGQWSVLADYNYTNLSFGNTLGGPANSELETSVKTQFLTALLGYRVRDDQSVKVDLAGGFRWYSTDTEFTLTPERAPSRTNTADDSWFDPVVGVRARFSLSDSWTSTAYVDYGGFRSGSQTWSVLLTADYAINERWVLRGGYRYISFDHDINGSEYKFDQSGPLFGATYRF
ncbi:outer membrane beta-barrel protein [Ruegeria arenilitoris]|uniref:outer membrane beta-barrel protein n=1 Tax=Ruegeria arenilitoris TaxID=1173585 RepID=UPI0020C23FFF|nr:outer membrane beta-barrel protein [Ruegeria arenilitoris]